MQTAILAIAAGTTFRTAYRDHGVSETMTAVWYSEQGLGSTHHTPVEGGIPAFRSEQYSDRPVSDLIVTEGDKVSHGGQTFIATAFETDDECWVGFEACDA